MKKILFATLGLLWVSSGVPQIAKASAAGSLPVGFGQGFRGVPGAMVGVVEGPCTLVSEHLKKFQSCPEGMQCYTIPTVVLETVTVENQERCRVHTPEASPADAAFGGRLDGIYRRVNFNDLTEVTITGSLFGDVNAYFSFDVEDPEFFKRYEYFRWRVQFEPNGDTLISHRLQFAEIRVVEPVAEGGPLPVIEPADPVGPQGDDARAAPEGLVFPRGAVGDVVRALGDDARQAPHEGDREVNHVNILPAGRRLGGIDLGGIPGAKKEGKPALKLPFKFASDEAVKRLMAGGEPEAGVDPDAAVDGSDSSASESDGTPVANLEATEVNPGTNTLCSLNTNLVPNLSSLAYVGFAFIGMVLAGIRRRIRSRRDR